MANADAVGPAAVTNRREFEFNQRTSVDMSDNVRAVAIAQATSNTDVARHRANEKKYEFASPARNDTARALGVICGELAMAALGKYLALDWHITSIGMIVIGGIYGVPKAIEKWVGAGGQAPGPPAISP